LNHTSSQELLQSKESICCYHPNMNDHNNVHMNEIIDSLPQASHTMTWSIISYDESETMEEDYITY
jgi:hypothetical protein